MDEAAKYLLGQGILGLVVLGLAIAVVKLWRTNQSLADRLENKSEKHAEMNREIAKQVVEAFNAATKSTARRRNTRAVPE